MKSYDSRFYGGVDAAAVRSAQVVVPMVIELVRPTSVIDVGCGLGAWAAEFAEAGVADVWGADGDTVDTAMLRIPPERFRVGDLSQPLRLDRTFDLVVSLEVAEHLPPRSASTFVASLTALGPVVLFSAAIPGQGGVHHVNEQWPSYWAARFGERGYCVIDAIRAKVWDDDRVSWWYAQNLLLFASGTALERSPTLRDAREAMSGQPLDVVHPAKYLDVIAPQLMERELASLVPAGATVAVIGSGVASAIQFLDWGLPRDDQHAIDELQRLRDGGVEYLVFSRESFWWLDHYRAFAEHLQANDRLVVRNDVVAVFDIR